MHGAPLATWREPLPSQALLGVVTDYELVVPLSCMTGVLGSYELRTCRLISLVGVKWSWLRINTQAFPPSDLWHRTDPRVACCPPVEIRGCLCLLAPAETPETPTRGVRRKKIDLQTLCFFRGQRKKRPVRSSGSIPRSQN